MPLLCSCPGAVDHGPDVTCQYCGQLRQRFQSCALLVFVGMADCRLHRRAGMIPSCSRYSVLASRRVRHQVGLVHLYEGVQKSRRMLAIAPLRLADFVEIAAATDAPKVSS